jgi:hypothetical protein
MKKLKNLGRILSKGEQKKIMGGDYGEGCYHCWCQPAPGMSWTDCTGRSFYEVIADADDYCRTHSNPPGANGGACTQY